MNIIAVAGNVVATPELRYTNAGTAQATMRLGVNRRFQQNGEWKQESTFVTIVTFGDLAESSASELEKGTKVVVTGRLSLRDYETKDGQKRSVTEIIADEIGIALKKHGNATARSEAKSTATFTAEEPF